MKFIRSSFFKTKPQIKVHLEIPSFICIIGIDGSGKTTLAKRLVDSFESDSIRYYYLWGGIDKLTFMAPMRRFIYLSLLRRKNNPTMENIEQKKSLLLFKHRKLVRIYYLLIKIDYVFRLFIKMIYFRLAQKRIISDRYFFDVAINIALAQNLSEPSIYSFIESCLRFLPKPDLLIWLDVPVAIAIRRKGDVPNREYLLRRQKIYKQIAIRYSATRIDGTKPIKDMESEIFHYLSSWGK